MNFCNHCGSDKIILKIPEGDTHHRFFCENCHTIHYQNPNMVVGTLSVYEGKVLLAKRAIDPRKGLWNLPAGFLENGEKVEEGAIRETLEETGAEIDILRLQSVFSLPQFNQIYLIFLAELKHNDFHFSTTESIEVRLFELEDIPWSEIAFASTDFALRKYIENPDKKEVEMGVFYRGMKEGDWL